MGVTRQVDDLGRITIPKSYREELNIKEGEQVEVELSNDHLVVTQFNKIKTKEEIQEKLNQLVESVTSDDLVSIGFIAALKWTLNLEDNSNS